MLLKIIDIMIDELIKVRSFVKNKKLFEEDGFWMDELLKEYAKLGY